MSRPNPRGDVPIVHDSTFVDPTAILCGRVIAHENVFIGPTPSFALSRRTRLRSDRRLE